MYRITSLLFLWTILQGCTAYKPIIDIGKQDLFSEGLSPDYNNNSGVYRNYILRVQPEQISRDTIFQHISSRAFTSIKQKDGAIGLEKPNVYPEGNWNAYVNQNGYIITSKSFNNRLDSIWNVDSFSYKFKGNKPIQVVRHSSRFSSEDIKYLIDYSRRGLISKIAIVDHMDSLIVQRTYSYTARKLATYTIDGKSDTVERKEYVFGKNNTVLEQTTDLILKGTIKKYKVEYSTDSTFITKWEEFDKNGQVVASGYDRHLNSLIMESESDFYGSWKHKDYALNVYNNNKSLSNTTHIYSSPSQSDTTVTTYTYQNNFEHKVKKTVTEYDCSKCRNCGNCEYINAVIIKYE